MNIKIDEIDAKAKEILTNKYSSCDEPEVETRVTIGKYYSFVRIGLKNRTILGYEEMKQFQRSFAKSKYHTVNVCTINDYVKDSTYLEVYIDINGLKPKFVDYEH